MRTFTDKGDTPAGSQADSTRDWPVHARVLSAIQLEHS